MKRALFVVLLVVGVALNVTMTPWYDTLFKSQETSMSATEVMLEALGEIRTFLAQTIWLETDLYHHEMERQNIPWTEEKDIMAMYKIVTMLDPRFVDAYDLAAYQLVENFHRPKEGLAFLEEGLRNNPNSATLHFEKAYLNQRLKNYPLAIQEAGIAMQLYAPDPVALLNASPEKQIDFMNAARIVAQCYESMGNRDGEVHYRKILLMFRPDDIVSSNRLKTLNAPPGGYTPQEFIKFFK